MPPVQTARIDVQVCNPIYSIPSHVYVLSIYSFKRLSVSLISSKTLQLLISCRICKAINAIHKIRNTIRSILIIRFIFPLPPFRLSAFIPLRNTQLVHRSVSKVFLSFQSPVLSFLISSLKKLSGLCQLPKRPDKQFHCFYREVLEFFRTKYHLLLLTNTFELWYTFNYKTTAFYKNKYISTRKHFLYLLSFT